MGLHALEVLELDISRWAIPAPETMLRAILLDFVMYVPGLQQVILWVGQTRFAWYPTHDGDWQNTRLLGRAPGFDNVWRSF